MVYTSIAYQVDLFFKDISKQSTCGYPVAILTGTPLNKKAMLSSSKDFFA